MDVGSEVSSALIYCSMDFLTGNPQGNSGMGKVANDFRHFVDLTVFGCITDHI